MSEQLPQVTVAVLTFRRNDHIAELVPLLANQIESASEICQARLVVIDNDPDGGAESVVTPALAASGVAGRYVHERRPGLVAARNRALSEASGSDALVFIDDDERPVDGWLTRLVQTWQRTGAWAVTGPVRSIFEVPPSRWVQGSGLFDRLTDQTGRERNSAATNNLLLDLRRLHAARLRFDERFSATGGEDSFIMQSLRGAGGNIIWCDEAEVAEVVPAARLRRSWVLQRSMRMGESWATVRILLTSNSLRRTLKRVEFIARGLRTLIVRAPRAIWAKLRNDAAALGAHESAMAGGRGLVRGALGLRYQEYQRR